MLAPVKFGDWCWRWPAVNRWKLVGGFFQWQHPNEVLHIVGELGEPRKNIDSRRLVAANPLWILA